MSFELDIAKFAAKAGKNADKVVRKVCLDITRQVITPTPVDIGRAKGNWQATIGAPAVGTVERLDKDGSATITAASAAIQAAPGRVFYLTNNLPYIRRLEFLGWSNQAPNGWVRLAVARAKAAIT